jgi:hypothetical protein
MLSSIARSAIEEAARTASDVPGRLGQAVDDALAQAGNVADQVAALPGQVLDELKDIAEHPDWLGLLTFVLVRLVELTGDPALSVVAHDPGDGWARAVGVRWTPDATTELLVSFAVAGAGTHGVAVRIVGAPTFETDAGPVRVSAKANGAGSWRFGLGVPIQAPAQAASLVITAAVRNDLLPAGGDPIAVGVGRPRVTVGATSQPLEWSAEAAFEGEGGAAGLRARVDLAPLLGALGAVVAMTPIDERYSPTVRVGSATTPKLDLKHEGI